MSAIFEKYASIYNAFYKDKDYKTELDLVFNYLGALELTRVLEFGSGTGSFTKFLDKKIFENSYNRLHLPNDKYVNMDSSNEFNCEIIAVEPSIHMLQIAKTLAYQNRLLFFNVSASDFVRIHSNLLPETQLVIALFHVFSYLKFSDLLILLSELVQNLKSGSFLCFDFWDRSAVKANQPRETTRITDDGFGNHIKRISKPTLVKVNEFEIIYDIEFSFFSEQAESSEAMFTESHKMHAFDAQHIKETLSKSLRLIADLDLTEGGKYEGKNYGRTLIFGRR